VIVALLCSRVR